MSESTILEVLDNKRSWEIATGDCLDLLRTMPDNSVHCVATSPPYYGLRNYKVDGQIGMEQSPFEFIEKLTDVFSEVKRVLRPDGTLWLNIGDSYSATGKGGRDESPETNKAKRSPRGTGRWGGGNNEVTGLPAKNLIGIPWRLAWWCLNLLIKTDYQ